MRRRACLAALGGAIAAWPLVPGAQQLGKPFSIGFLFLTTSESTERQVRAFKEGLREHGYVEDRDIVFERRYAEGRLERLPDLAAELVRLRVDAIVAASSNPAIAAARQATATIPIVMVTAVDPVGAGFIASLARPGGNVTGLTVDTGPEILGKRLEIIKEILPGLSRVAVLREAGWGTDSAALEAAARQLGITLAAVDFRGPDDFESAFAAMIRNRAGAFMMMATPITYMRRQRIADLALEHRLPGIHTLNEYAQAGLLATYGPSLLDLFRRAASYVAKLLKGANPADLPVEQPTKFELVINLKTARALGIAVPESLLARADEVIE